MLPHDERGAGPALVLIHAGVADRGMWAEHLEPLAAAGFRVIAVDLPGYGDAPVPDELAEWLDIVATLDALGIESATLVGDSFGAAVALSTAIVAPERVDALVLVSMRFPDEEPSPQLEAAWTGEREALERGDVDGAVAAIVEAWTLPDAPAELRERIAAMQRRAVELQIDAEPAEAADPLQQEPDPLPSVAARTLVAYGEHDMPDFAAAAARLATTLPNVTLHVFKGAGHLAPLEQPDAFRAELVRFLQASAQSPLR